MATYWEKRETMLYYQAVRALVEGINPTARSIVDVGSSGCPYLDWFPRVPRRTSIDLRKPYSGDEIESITIDFLRWEPEIKYDLALCLQVLEHVPDAKPFAQKLLTVAECLVISVPYKWKAGKTKNHIHDPVDEAKLADWFGRAPNFSYLVREIDTGVRRLIQVYEHSDSVWTSTNQRRRQQAKSATGA